MWFNGLTTNNLFEYIINIQIDSSENFSGNKIEDILNNNDLVEKMFVVDFDTKKRLLVPDFLKLYI